MVIYGALLGVLDPVLTLAAAGDKDGTRYPAANRQQQQGPPADSSVDGGAESSVGEGGEGAGMFGGGGRGGGAWDFTAATKARDARKLELAGNQASDHAVTLAAFKVGARWNCGVGVEYTTDEAVSVCLCVVCKASGVCV